MSWNKGNNHIVPCSLFGPKYFIYKRRFWHQKPSHVQTDSARVIAFRDSEQLQTQVRFRG